MLSKAVCSAALVAGVCGSVAVADVVVSTRNSVIEASLITLLPAPAPVTSTAVDSAADLVFGGAGTYTDGFGRDFAGTYAALQDVEFGSGGLSGQLSQAADTILNSAGFPASSVFSVNVNNRYESSFTVTEDTTLRVTLNLTGTVTPGSAADRLDFRLNTTFGSLYVLPLEVPSGQYTNEPVSIDLQFLAGTTYFVVAEGRAFSGGGEGSVSSSLSFSIAPIPAPSALSLAAVMGLGAMRRRR